MEKKPDITSRQDIEKLVNAFYASVQKNNVIGPFFNEIAHVDWTKHLPKMYSFWEFLLLGTGSYKGNVTLPHVELNQKEKLLPDHFNVWVTLFQSTVDEYFSGPKAEEIKLRALSIAGVMSHKIEEINAQ
jgi:hemoglobin